MSTTKINATLYKMSGRGKIQEWEVSIGEDTYPYYSVKHGQQDGKKQVTKVYVKEGKNLGKKNATTASEQCLSEAESLWTKQRDRKGYSEKIPTEPPLRPMLAKKYQDEKHKLEFPVFIQPKLDGIRCMTTPSKLVSRTNKEFGGLDHIKDYTQTLSYRLDGELYSPDITFQEIVSRVKNAKKSPEEAKQIKYHVYDYIDPKNSFHQRYTNLSYKVRNTDYVKKLETYLCDSEEKVMYFYDKFIDQGYEGAIIRCRDAKYEINKRSSGLLKLKSFIDKEFEIIGHKTGKGKFENVPTFILKDEDSSIFEAVPKGTSKQREQMLNDAKSLYGEMATVRYFELTDDNLPRFPVLIAIRDYE